MNEWLNEIFDNTDICGPRPLHSLISFITFHFIGSKNGLKNEIICFVETVETLLVIIKYNKNLHKSIKFFVTIFLLFALLLAHFKY